MATTVPSKPLYLTLNMTEDLAGKTYRFVLADGALCGADEVACGITTDDVEDFSAAGAERQVDVQAGMHCVITAGAAIAVNAQAKSDADGRAILAASGEHANVLTLRAASGAGEQIPCLWMPTLVV